MNESDINQRFDKKLEELEVTLPKMGSKAGSNCAVQTFTNVLEILGLDNPHYHNMAVPLAGGFGGFKSEHGWKGPCGVIGGGCAAIGVIMGGNEKIKPLEEPKIYAKVASFVHSIEKEFGSVTCRDLSGVDMTEAAGYQAYAKNKIWENVCYKYILFAIDQVRKITQRDLKKKW